MGQAQADLNVKAPARASRSRIAARAAILAASFGLIGAVVWAYGADVLFWAIETQQQAQNSLARAVRGVRSGDAAALTALLGASFVYGFAHAAGPGHGKLLIAGAATASRKAAWKMAFVGFLASLTQALSAIVLMYGALGLFSLTGNAAKGLAQDWLTPLSAAAVCLVGGWLIWRGIRGLNAARAADEAGCGHGGGHGGGQGCGEGCKHMPTAEEAERADGWFETLSLVLSIGVRPCSGALIVLAIAWSFGLYAAGALSAVAMAVGTGVVVSGVALFAAGLRDAQYLRGDDGASRRLLAWVQVFAGLTVAVLSGAVMVSSLLA